MDPNQLLFPLAKRFVAGVTRKDALAAVDALAAKGLRATLDFLGEDVTQVAEAEATTAEYEALAQALGSRPGVNFSVKLTALGLGFDPDGAGIRLARIQAAAATLSDHFVRVDMERADTVERTLEVVLRLQARGFEIGPVLQSYLRRTPADVERMIERKVRVRLCKGAYSEPAQIAFTDKAAIRREFLRAAERLLEHGTYPAIATHDIGLIEAVKRFAAERNIAADRFELQMLYGVRPALQEALAAEGYRVRVYIPYGTHWVGYFRRRILERRENALFAFSAMFTK